MRLLHILASLDPALVDYVKLETGDRPPDHAQNFPTAIAAFFRNFGLINIKNQPKH
ncbi:hypothetical protein [Cylindrospermopsis raciborskii]|uniref:hypothetical protein n=1 Tax=Cylindrospermopsis raciborskii TaxID=77022 RepID=UPI001365D7EC|nr:hypothetical protein [Cylindrospermopsis raciborskii]